MLASQEAYGEAEIYEVSRLFGNILEERSVRLPQDISVVGVDDIFFAKLTRPPLTTVRIPREELGRMSFLALERIGKSKRHQGSEYTPEVNWC